MSISSIPENWVPLRRHRFIVDIADLPSYNVVSIDMGDFDNEDNGTMKIKYHVSSGENLLNKLTKLVKVGNQQTLDLKFLDSAGNIIEELNLLVKPKSVKFSVLDYENTNVMYAILELEKDIVE